MTVSACQHGKEVKLGSGHIRVPDNIAEEPVLVGHELLGTICKVGKKWADEYKEGERFVVLPGIPDQMGAPGILILILEGLLPIVSCQTM